GRPFRLVTGQVGDDPGRDRWSGHPPEGSTVQFGSGFREAASALGTTAFRRMVLHVALFGALAVVPVLALNSLATADTGGPVARPGLTQARRPRQEVGQRPPGCGSPTSNHQRASSS